MSELLFGVMQKITPLKVTNNYQMICDCKTIRNYITLLVPVIHIHFSDGTAAPVQAESTLDKSGEGLRCCVTQHQGYSPVVYVNESSLNFLLHDLSKSTGEI